MVKDVPTSSSESRQASPDLDRFTRLRARLADLTAQVSAITEEVERLEAEARAAASDSAPAEWYQSDEFVTEFAAAMHDAKRDAIAGKNVGPVCDE